MNRRLLAVMGGSIGGLTAAVLLRDAGWEVEVFERSPSTLAGRGAGIVLHPESARYLVDRLGYRLDQISERARWLRFLDRDGKPTYQTECRYRFTAWNTLYLPLRQSLGEDAYHFGREVTVIHPGPDEVMLEFADGDTDTCSLLVCADGIASTARDQLLPQAGPRFAGYLGWRGVVRESELDPEVFEALYEAITYYTPTSSHILSYPIPNPNQGERLLNYVWYRNLDGDLGEAMTDRHGERRALSIPPGAVAPHQTESLYTAAEELLPRHLAMMVTATTEPFIQAVVDVEVPQMAFGRLALMGDAAFAARPHAAAGTAKAAADAWALVMALERAEGDIPAGLAAWESERLGRGRELVARARRLGVMAQIENRFQGDDPEILFGLERAGDSCFDN
ncbi:MAG: NAD(P)-binding protein [Acidimicrobiia bacterium]|nr:NAD(P)-binding protein [Acidimicrobiia bacterium]